MAKNIAALATIGNFCCTENYYRHSLSRGVVFTDGVKFLADNAEAYWLVDEVCILQMHEGIKKDARLQQMQFWTLKKNPSGKGATLICERDSGDVAMEKPIEFTDFPFQAFAGNEVRLWVAPTQGADGKLSMVCYLPSEH